MIKALLQRTTLLFALLLAFGIGCAHSQQTITYTNDEINSSGIVITLATNPTTLTIASGTATQSGDISDSGTAGNVDLNGAGTLILSGTNSNSGTTTIGAGTLQAGSDSALSAESSFIVTGTLDLHGNNNTVASLSGTGIVTDLSPNINSVLTVGNSGSTAVTTFSGSIQDTPSTGSISLDVAGGTLILTGTNLFNGGTAISGGTLELAGNGFLGVQSTHNGVTLSNAGELLTNEADINPTSGTITINGSGTIAAVNGTQGAYYGPIEGGALTVGDSVNGGVVVLDDTIMDGASPTSVTVVNGLVYEEGLNTYTGGTNLNGGELSLGFSGALGTTGTISFGGGTLQFTSANTTDYSSRFSTAANQLYSIDTNGQSVTFAGNLTSSGGSLTKLGSGILTLSGNNTYTGATTITAGTLQLGNGGQVTDNTGNIGTLAGSSGTATVTGVNANGTASTWNNAVMYVGSAGTGTLTIENGGEVTDTNAYLGNNSGGSATVTVTGITGNGVISTWNNSGYLKVGGGGNGTLTIQDGGYVTDLYGYIGYNAQNGSFGTGMVTVTGINGNGVASTWSNTQDLYVGATATGILTISNGGQVTDTDAYIGSSGGSGNGHSGTATVTGVNANGVASTWTSFVLNVGGGNPGTLTVQNGGVVNASYLDMGQGEFSGTLNLNSNGVLETNSITATTGNNAINFNGGILRATADTFTGYYYLIQGGAITLASGGGTIDNNGHSVTNYNTSISGGGGLTSIGSGTFTLTGTNTYTGATTISSGTLSVTGSISSSAVSVANGATLSGTGSTGFATISGGGNINLQDGKIGTLTVGGLSTGNASTPSAFSFDIQTLAGTTTVDKIADTGILTLKGVGGTTITIGSLSATSALTSAANTYALLTYTGAQQALDDFTLLTTSLDGKILSLSQTGDTVYLNVAAPVSLITITTTSPLSSGIVGTAYNQTLAASGGTGPYTWSIASGSLPSGLSLSSDGVISGTPATAGTYTATVTASNGAGSGSAMLTLTVAKGTASVTLGNLAAAYDGTAKLATATTSPVGLNVTFTYNGKSTVPVAVGSYTVVGTINDANYAGSATDTLVIGKGTATVILVNVLYSYNGSGVVEGNIGALYNGRAHAVTARTVPPRLSVLVTYNGSATVPVLVGDYTVVGTINDANYVGSATATLTIIPIAPRVTTSIATLISASSATLNSVITPGGAATTSFFQYGLTTLYGAYGNTTTTQNAGGGTTSVIFSQGISGLAPSTLYHYRAVATNAAGTVFGLDKTFTTLAKPIFGSGSSGPMAYLGASGAEVSLGVNPNGVATSVSFQYSTDPNFGTFLQTAAQSVGSGKLAVTVYALFPGLAPGTPYYYRMVTTSAAGTSTSDPATFTTLSFDTTLVAQKGDFAVGSSGPTFASFGNPAVNVNDDVAFAATLTLATGSVTTANDMGIWIDSNGTRQLIAQIGSSANGTGGNFLTLSDPVFNDNGAVAFKGTLKILSGQVSSTNTTGIWSTVGGSLHIEARQGDPAPGTAGPSNTLGTFSTFTALGLCNSGPVFYATLNSGTDITTANNAGIWESNNGLRLLLRLGQTMGDKTIIKLTFTPAETVVNGQTHNFNANGDVAANASFNNKTTGIVHYHGGASQIDVESTLPADELAGNTYASFGNPSINNNNHVAYQATLTTSFGGATSANNAGIWAQNSVGTRHLIARTGSTIAPGTSGTYVSFSDPVYNNNDAVAFRGTLKVVTGQVTATTATGIWCNSTGALAIVARQGGQAPGCPAGAKFSAFTELALADQGGATNQGGVILLATLNANTTAGVTAVNDLGIWAVDTTGTLQLIVRTGDILGGKTVTGLAFLPSLATVGGQSRSFAQANGDLVYLATFSDKSTGIYNVVFP